MCLHIIIVSPSEKIAALQTLDYLKDRAIRGDGREFETILARVPDAEPDEQDRL